MKPQPQNTSDEPPRFRPLEPGEGPHRGGSWKVAYADFVTALMALFIVLWLMNSSRQVQQAVSAYFNDPRAHAKAASQGTGTGPTAASGPAANKENAEQFKEKLERALSELPEWAKLKDHVQISITNEGIRIELMETEQGLFFERARPEPSANGVRMLSLLARELGRLPNELVIEGHTDSHPYRYSDLYGYGNWELSVDRANAARRCMQGAGVGQHQVAQVRGYADKHLLAPGDPYNSRNRRVSVVVGYQAAAASK
ncbi:MAG: flagellar motor protein MotB [Bryobacteraceae bacterium]